jgi:hypothetical protein|nr:MAG TPA: acetyltransferase domain containing protein [Inoviridae sp.]
MSANFREISLQDKELFVELMREFYHSPAVLHPVPDEYFCQTVDEALAGSPYVKAFILEQDGRTAGYGLLALTYSAEAGGLVVWLEELYIRDAFRGLGLGGGFIRFVEDAYKGKAARLRLEAEPDNTGAIRLYKRLGFEELPYKQLIKPMK